MNLKLAESEIKVMEALWEVGEGSAKQISDIITDRYGWNINSTYTILKRCIKKGAIERKEPGFWCRPLVTREAIQQQETRNLLDRVFDGSADKLFTALIDARPLTNKELQEIKRMVDSLEAEDEDL